MDVAITVQPSAYKHSCDHGGQIGSGVAVRATTLFGEVPQHDEQSGEEGRNADRQDEHQDAEPAERLRNLGEDAFAMGEDDRPGMPAERQRMVLGRENGIGLGRFHAPPPEYRMTKIPTPSDDRYAGRPSGPVKLGNHGGK